MDHDILPNPPFLSKYGIKTRLDDSLISSVFALNVTPKTVIFLFLILLFNIFELF